MAAFCSSVVHAAHTNTNFLAPAKKLEMIAKRSEEWDENDEAERGRYGVLVVSDAEPRGPFGFDDWDEVMNVVYLGNASVPENFRGDDGTDAVHKYWFFLGWDAITKTMVMFKRRRHDLLAFYPTGMEDVREWLEDTTPAQWDELLKHLVPEILVCVCFVFLFLVLLCCILSFYKIFVVVFCCRLTLMTGCHWVLCERRICE